LKISVYILCVLFVLFTQCKKYPEDNFISLKTSERRLTKYKWKIETVKFEGQVVNDIYNDSLQLGELQDLEFQFSSVDSYDESVYNISYPQNPNFNLFGRYDLNRKYGSFDFFYLRNSADSVEKKEEKIFYNLLCTKTWSILKLYRKDFKLKNIRNYEIVFKPVN
jgi:hypothetical protein